MVNLSSGGSLMAEQLTNQLRGGGSNPTSPLQYIVRGIPAKQTYEWLLKKHYAHRIPSILFSFGLYDNKDLLKGVCTFGIPASHDLCNFICGADFASHVLELNRLVVNDNHDKNATSFFVSKCLRLLPKPKIIVSYSDTGQGHQGYIYQATNFIYTGKTKPQKDLKIKGTNLHSRHAYDYPDLETEYVDRTIKNRYIYFVGDRRQIENYRRHFRLESLPYPKGDNTNYDASYNPSIQGVLV